MKGHVKRTIDVLIAVGFVLDEDASRHGKCVYRHHYEPDTPLKVWAGMSEAACIAVQRKANQIADTGHQGPSMPKTLDERNKILRDKAKRERDRDDRARAQRAACAEREYEQRAALAAADRHHHDVEALMQPGHGRTA